MFLGFSYLAYLSLVIQVNYLEMGMPAYLGLGVGAVLAVLGAVYMAIYWKSASHFT